MNTQALGIIAALGLLLPNLQSVIQRPWWSSRTKTFLTIGVSALGGLVGYVSINGLTLGSPSDAVLWVVGVYLASVTFYHGLLKPSGIAGGIEVGTSPTVDDADLEVDDPEDEDVDLEEEEPEVDPFDLEEDPDDGELEQPEDFDDGAGPIFANSADEAPPTPHDAKLS